MTVEQGNQINQLYKKYNDTIGLLKDSITIKNIKYDSIYQEARSSKDSSSTWKWKYEGNRKIYTDWQKDLRKIEKIQEVGRLILVGIIILQFQTINQLRK